jgi:hypothetical protein
MASTPCKKPVHIWIMARRTVYENCPAASSPHRRLSPSLCEREIIGYAMINRRNLEKAKYEVG